MGEPNTPNARAVQGAAEEAERFRLLVESVKDYAIFVLDPSGHILSWNSGAERIKGYVASEIIGQHFSIFYPAAEVASGKCERELEVATREGRFEEEGWRVRKDGTRFWANVTITALRNLDGGLVGFAKVTQDLTQRRFADEEARRFQLLVESVKDYAIFVLDPKGHIATWNIGAQRIKGYSSGEIIGRHFSIFYPPEDIAAGKCERELETATLEGRFEEEGWRLRKDGTYFWANVTITALHNPEGALVGFAKVTRDLTERREAEEERLRLAQAEEAERRTQDFLAVMGHELRNPLAPMVTAVHRLRLRGGRNCDQEIAVLGRQLTQLSRLVNDLLDASRFTRKDVPMTRAAVDLGEVLADAVDVAAPLLEEKRHDLRIEGGTEELLVDGDRERLAQVFGNILTNAAKYTNKRGCIWIRKRIDSDEVVISIEDNGTGIAPDVLPHVFELFTQAEQGIDRHQGGLGIGLSVAKTVVERHGGSIVATSPGVGLGTCVTVRLPRAQASRAVAPSEIPAIRPSRAPRRVLVVDDSRDAAEMVALCLADIGHDVHLAFDGPSALDEARKFEPDVVFLDIGLPGMSGYEVAKAIRHLEHGAKIPIIAVTGYAREIDRENAMAAGFTLHIAKPIEITKLGAMIDELTRPALRAAGDL